MSEREMLAGRAFLVRKQCEQMGSSRMGCGVVCPGKGPGCPELRLRSQTQRGTQNSKGP